MTVADGRIEGPVSRFVATTTLSSGPPGTLHPDVSADFPAFPGPNLAIAQPVVADLGASAAPAPRTATIRPLSLAPPAPRSAVDEGHAVQGQVSLYSGDGNPPPDKPPNLTGSGGSWAIVQKLDHQGMPDEGQYEIPEGVPVGSVFLASAGDPAPGYHIKTWSWSGDTGISSYISADPGIQPFGEQEVGRNVSTNSTDYVFIIDARDQEYTVTVDVTYFNGAKGQSTVKFNPVRPAAELSVARRGTQVVDYPAGAAQALLSPGLLVDATTTAHSNHGGKFMFMQTLNSVYRFLRDDLNNPYYQKNDHVVPGGENYDGPLLDAGSLGYPHFYDGAYHLSWTSGPGRAMPVPAPPPQPTPEPPQLHDSPAFGVLNTCYALAVAEEFSTYLMYKPPAPAVWIALDALDWSWSQSASRPVGAAWPAVNPTPQPNPTPRTPGDGAEFPTWVNTTNTFRNDQNSWRFGVGQP